MQSADTARRNRQYSDEIVMMVGALFLGCCLGAGSPPPHARLSEDQRQIVLNSPARASQFVLRLEDLPAESTIAPGLQYATKRFGHVQVSPDGKHAAFTTIGHHSMVGLVHLQTGKPTEIDLVAEGDVLALHWSPDGRFLAYDVLPASGYRRVNVYDVQTMSPRKVRVPDGGSDVHVLFQGWGERPAWLRLVVTDIQSKQKQLLNIDLEAD